MSTMVPEAYQERKEAIPPFEVHIVSYRAGGTFRCTIDNVDPGAVIARSEGSTREEAEARALERAKKLLSYSVSRVEKG